MKYIKTYEVKLEDLDFYNNIKNFGDYIKKFFDGLDEDVKKKITIEEYDLGSVESQKNTWLSFFVNIPDIQDVPFLDLGLKKLKVFDIDSFYVDMISNDDWILDKWQEGLLIIVFLRKFFNKYTLPSRHYDDKPGPGHDFVIKVSDIKNIINDIETEKEDLEIRITSMKYNL